MIFYNINDHSEKVTLKDAVLRSVINQSGLYMPQSFPVMPKSFFDKLPQMSIGQIGFDLTKIMFGDDIPDSEIENIVTHALNFDIPLKQLDDNISVLELFHGPTLAFKDVGARFMAGLFEYLLHSNKLNTNSQKDTVILVATSGDTGSAVANAFFNRKGIKVVILYPSGKVSNLQEKQLTTMGGNITTLEVDGNFDDCQSMVKQAFSDKELNEQLSLTSANSINFARLFPQSFYYFYAYGQLVARDRNKSSKNVIISVPSGNFGNLTAGLIAKKMGLSVDTFLAATNINHSVPDYLNNGIFTPKPTKQTITNAMDVGNPSNFPRMLELYNNNHNSINSDIKGYWFTDKQTMEGMNMLQKKYNYQADPHGALAYLALNEYVSSNCIFLETAHPAKFEESVLKATGIRAEIPNALDILKNLEKKSIRIPARYNRLKELLISI